MTCLRVNGDQPVMFRKRKRRRGMHSLVQLNNVNLPTPLRTQDRRKRSMNVLKRSCGLRDAIS